RPLTHRLSTLHRFRKNRVGTIQSTLQSQCLTKNRQETQTTRVVGRKQAGRALEQVPRGPRIGTGVRPKPGRGETFHGSLGKGASPLARPPEPRQTVVRLLEVIADHLVELLTPALEPAGEALVQLRAELLGDTLVGGVADQYVTEAEDVLDRLVRTDQLLADERRALACGGPSAVGSQRL